MPGSSSVVDQLQGQLEVGLTAVKTALTDADEARIKLKQKQDAQASLQRALDEARSATAAADKALAASTDPSATATRAMSDIDAALATTLSAHQRAAVDDAIKGVDDERKKLATTKDKADAAVDSAAAKAEAAAAASVAAAQRLTDALAALRNRGAVVTQLTATVTGLAAKAKAALDGNRPGSAYRLNKELGKALESLAQETGKKRSDDLQSDVTAASTDADAKRQAAAEAELDAARERATREAAAKKLGDYEAGLATLVDTKIATLEQQWALTPPAAPVAPVDGGG